MSMEDRDGFIQEDGKRIDRRESTAHVVTCTLHRRPGFDGRSLKHAAMLSTV